jgi:type II secretory pathway pseudopilin PulG
MCPDSFRFRLAVEKSDSVLVGRIFEMMRIQKVMGFTLLEMLVAVGVVGLILAMLLPAVQNARETARRIHCQNNSKQIILATHAVHDSYGSLPPLSAPCRGMNLPFCLTQNNTRYGRHSFTLFTFLLPAIERQSVFDNVKTNASIGGDDVVISTYICPTDPSVENGRTKTNWNFSDQYGASSYSANNYVFGNPPGKLTYGRNRLPESIPDGSSNTLFIAEKFATCSNTGSLSGSSGPEGSVTGSHWGNANDLWRAGFNLGSLKRGLSVTSYPASPMFQYNPSFNKDCSLERTQTAHPGGIVVALGDGSSRTLAPAMDEQTWSRINDPRDGAIVSID